MLFCPADGVALSEAHLEAFVALVGGCEQARSYVPSWWRLGERGTIEGQVQFKGGPYGALEAVWQEHGSLLRCVWVRSSVDFDGLDTIYRIDEGCAERDDFCDPGDRRAWYGFDELHVTLSPLGRGLTPPPPWERLGEELKLRARGAYRADNDRWVFDADGPTLPTPSTPSGGEGQPLLDLSGVWCPLAEPLLGLLDQGATRVEARYRGRLVLHCAREADDGGWPRWRIHALDHWDNCLDRAFLLDQGRADEALPEAVYALPHPRPW